MLYCTFLLYKNITCSLETTKRRKMELQAARCCLEGLRWICSILLGNNKSWDSTARSECDYVFGIENINKVHWEAYSYDFKNKTGNVYDSMQNDLKDERMEVFEKHAIIAPSLYNLNSEKHRMACLLSVNCILEPDTSPSIILPGRSLTVYSIHCFLKPIFR
ncbi:hypothetical protein Leryth_002306 [Lithospermum erythrorhizon]|nr:hypothetical protein Leryth_002306 [Lithospermum erythrorhizon]